MASIALVDAGFCTKALEDTLVRHGKPAIFSSDQGSQFTSTAFTAVLLRETIAIDMGRNGRRRDYMVVERPGAREAVQTGRATFKPHQP